MMEGSVMEPGTAAAETFQSPKVGTCARL